MMNEARLGVGIGVGLAVGFGVGNVVGFRVGNGVGFGVGTGVGIGAGVGTGVGTDDEGLPPRSTSVTSSRSSSVPNIKLRP